MAVPAGPLMLQHQGVVAERFPHGWNFAFAPDQRGLMFMQLRVACHASGSVHVADDRCGLQGRVGTIWMVTLRGMRMPARPLAAMPRAAISAGARRLLGPQVRPCKRLNA